jgi:hypothetical protein
LKAPVAVLLHTSPSRINRGGVFCYSFYLQEYLLVSAPTMFHCLHWKNGRIALKRNFILLSRLIYCLYTLYMLVYTLCMLVYAVYILEYAVIAQENKQMMWQMNKRRKRHEDRRLKGRKIVKLERMFYQQHKYSCDERLLTRKFKLM